MLMELCIPRLLSEVKNLALDKVPHFCEVHTVGWWKVLKYVTCLRFIFTGGELAGRVTLIFGRHKCTSYLNQQQAVSSH